MRDWIVIGVLYAFGIGVFRILGGLGAAGEAIRRWGAFSASPSKSEPSSS